ncbi:Uncharacterised protein [Mycobacteroides abscessus subsp. abscessus]|nr:Uncharacterised protein [Mycobacteroides abscessus subsp. abscessus]
MGHHDEVLGDRGVVGQGTVCGRIDADDLDPEAAHASHLIGTYGSRRAR